jgi:hypothetical protein
MSPVQEELKRLEEARRIASELCPDAEFPNVSREPLWYGRRNPVKVDGRQILVDKEKGQWFGIVSDQYKLIRHEEVVAECHKALKEYEPVFGNVKIEVRTPYEGAKLVVIGTFPHATKDVAVGDPICPKIEFRSSYDQTWQLSGRVGMMRLRCSNGMTSFEQWQSFVKRHHVGQLPDISIIGESLASVQGVFERECERLLVWNKMKLTQELYDNVWTLLPLSANEKLKVEAMPLLGYESQPTVLQKFQAEDLTLLDLNNGVTQYVSHHIESDNRRMDIDPVIARTFSRVGKTNGR